MAEVMKTFAVPSYYIMTGLYWAEVVKEEPLVFNTEREVRGQRIPNSTNNRGSFPGM